MELDNHVLLSIDYQCIVSSDLIDGFTLKNGEMKKIVAGAGIVVMLLVTLGADIRRTDSSKTQATVKKKCIGYTIIEFGKGIDCNGDTLKLIRVNGVQILAGQAN
ncbi:MAG TPA: hypothetical protein VD927_17505 [Chryseosolibacter sp.]|nr:hypothetical protein [Chryseosolibacter sp.]